MNQHDFKEDLGNLKNAITSTQMGTLVVLGKDAAFEPGKPETYGPFSRIWWVCSRLKRPVACAQRCLRQLPSITDCVCTLSNGQCMIHHMSTVH